LDELVDGDEHPMLLVAVILVVWLVAALAAVALCLAARRGDEEMTAVRPVVLQAADGPASRRTAS
jgi:hypothetical protein